MYDWPHRLCTILNALRDLGDISFRCEDGRSTAEAAAGRACKDWLQVVVDTLSCLTDLTLIKKVGVDTDMTSPTSAISWSLEDFR